MASLSSLFWASSPNSLSVKQSGQPRVFIPFILLLVSMALSVKNRPTVYKNEAMEMNDTERSTSCPPTFRSLEFYIKLSVASLSFCSYSYIIFFLHFLESILSKVLCVVLYIVTSRPPVFRLHFER